MTFEGSDRQLVQEPVEKERNGYNRKNQHDENMKYPFRGHDEVLTLHDRIHTLGVIGSCERIIKIYLTNRIEFTLAARGEFRSIVDLFYSG